MENKRKNLGQRLGCQQSLSQAIDRYTTDYHASWATLSQCKTLQDRLGHHPLLSLKPVHVVAYRDARLAEKRAVSTVIRELAVLKHIVNLAVKEWGWLDVNPIASVVMPRGAIKRTRWLTDAEETCLLGHCLPWLAQIVRFNLQTGLRLSELLDLEWNNIYMQDRYLTILKSKNGEPRGIPLSDVAMGILQIIQDASGSMIHTGRVFRGPRDIPVTVNELQYAFRQAIRQAGLVDLHWHDLRHTFCTRLARNGIDLYRIQILAGHKSPAMTQRYAHHSVESLRGAVGAI